MSLQYYVDDSNRKSNGKYFSKDELTGVNISSLLKFTTDVIYLKKTYDEYIIEDEDLIEEELTQIDKNRKEIEEGKSRSFENIDEYIKSLNEE